MAENEKDFLDEMNAEPEVEEETPEQPEPEKGDEPEQETPAEAEKEAEAPPAPESPKKDDRVPYAAMKAEREKRQAHEKRIAELEKALKEKADPPPSFYEAPDEYVHHAVSQVQQQANQRLYAALEEQAREAYPDYDEVFAEVEEHCADDPAAARQIMQSPNPALAAYKFGKQRREMQAMQNPEEYRAKLKAELLAELQSEQSAKDEARRKADAAIPPDLANARSAGDAPASTGSILSELFPE